MRLSKILILCLTCLLLVACASDGTVVNPFVTTEPAVPGATTYYAAFPDIPIPVDMNEQSADTFISLAPNGSKSGVQNFHGRVDALALITTMRTNMAGAGWTMRSFLRSKDSMLVYEKKNQVCTILVADGTIYTSMRIFVAPRLDGDSGGQNAGAYAPASASKPASQKLQQ